MPTPNPPPPRCLRCCLPLSATGSCEPCDRELRGASDRDELLFHAAAIAFDATLDKVTVATTRPGGRWQMAVTAHGITLRGASATDRAGALEALLSTLQAAAFARAS